MCDLICNAITCCVWS